jgi:hypothetical protein
MSIPFQEPSKTARQRWPGDPTDGQQEIPAVTTVTSRSTDRDLTDTETGASARRTFTILTGLSAAAVVLQGLWAGIFLEHDGERDAASSWIDVHARGGEVALLFAILATVVAVARLRARKDLLIGAIALTVLLVAEAYVGGLIRDESKDTLTAVHVPLAMAIMGLVVWLPLRASHRRG